MRWYRGSGGDDRGWYRGGRGGGGSDDKRWYRGGGGIFLSSCTLYSRFAFLIFS